MEKIIIELFRFWSDNDFTLGLVRIDGIGECFSLEDEYREVKVKGETRIWANRYQLKLRLVESPMTLKYRKIYPWFDWHIQVMDVPNFDYVYIHTGNNDDHTDACILLGETADVDGFIGRSRKAYERFYKFVRPLLDPLNGKEEVFIDIFDNIKGIR